MLLGWVIPLIRYSGIGIPVAVSPVEDARESKTRILGLLVPLRGNGGPSFPAAGVPGCVCGCSKVLRPRLSLAERGRQVREIWRQASV